MDPLPKVPRADTWIVTQNVIGEQSSSQLPNDWWKWTLGSIGMILLVGFIVGGTYMLKKSADNLAANVQKQTKSIQEFTDDTDAPATGFGGIQQVEAAYNNPFDKTTTYVNPFSSAKNPFDEVGQ